MAISSREKIEECLDSVIEDRPHQEIKNSVNDLVNNLTKKGFNDFAKYYIKLRIFLSEIIKRLVLHPAAVVAKT